MPLILPNRARMAQGFSTNSLNYFVTGDGYRESSHIHLTDYTGSVAVETTHDALSRPIPERIALVEVGPLRFRGGVSPGPPTRTYGGEVAAQSVLAAYRTVSADRDIHAAHMHFLLPGDTTVPVEFEVEESRDGRSFSSRHVRASQAGRVIFTMTASFQRPEKGLEHQVPRLDAPRPETLPTPEEMFADDTENLEWVRWLTDSIDVDARFPMLPARSSAARGHRVDPRQSVWLRSRRRVGTTSADRNAALAYISDLLLLSAALGPHQLTLQGGELQFATVSHSIWFHAPLSVEDWFLYEQDSRWAGSSRALCRGEMFDGTGRLCATTMQEGLIRVRS
ncbi:Acyl-CoA thioesterase 2 [Gordonia insulae]|uniref:Acyl-CoA thioesterase 2 n=1 Tax=Gordonia insulae TaxID=2420509 RepID=A0A3G8JMI7_9ACTN|nr:Acyl-CoA thioesterase 2 [Gordonia insulae]